MLFAHDYTTATTTPVETVEEAVQAALWGEWVTTLNPLWVNGRPVTPAALQVVYDRVAAQEADDAWPGAAYEADLVKVEWRTYRVAGSVTWRRYGPAMLQVLPRLVRA